MTVVGDPRLPPRFWSKVSVSDAGCWMWTAATDRYGYGAYAVTRRRTAKAHRVAYAALVGPSLDGLTLDHLCRVRRCVNPSHLEPCTAVENSLRSKESWRVRGGVVVFCRRGHPLEGDNLYVAPTGGRDCRTCRRALSARSKQLRAAR